MRQSLPVPALLKVSGRLTKKIISFQKNSGFLLLISILFLTAMQLTSVAQSVRYVRAGSGGDGSSWTSASGDLQAMINASSSGDQVWVAAGTYKPTTSADRTISFSMKDGIAIYGGFAGTERFLSQRPAITSSRPSTSILSGEIGTANTNDNSYHVISVRYPFSLSQTAILDGFIVTGGNANGDSYYTYSGGGIYFEQPGSATIRNCFFRSNLAVYFGAAIFHTGMSIYNCKFSDNVVSSDIGYGGAIYNAGGFSHVVNCSFSNNYARSGGAIDVYGAVNNVINCSFSGNNSGIFFEYSSQTSKITNCIFWANNNYAFHQVESSVNISYTDIDQDGFDGQNGNIRQDPLFVNAAGNDLHLKPNSPVINKGDNSANNTSKDLDDNPRVFGGVIDMGAYEFQCAPITISSHPQNASACKGSTATFTVAASGTNLIYKWHKGSTDISNNSPTLTLNNVQQADAGSYTVDVIGDCGTVTSNAATLTVNSPTAPVVTVTNNCGSSTLSTTATETLLWSTGETASSITVSKAGNYTVTQTVNGCTSDAGAGTAAPNAIPSTPIVSVTNNCGSSTLSTNASGSLLWSTSETTPSITVNTAGNYTVTQTVNGCTSDAGSGIAAPNANPSTPVVTVVNNCGSSTLSTNASGSLLWSTSETTPSIKVNTAGNYTVTQTVNGCTSDAGSADAAPKAIPLAPMIALTNNCGTSTLSTTATGTLLWSTGEITPSITVNTAGRYTLTQTVNGCTSEAWAADAAPKDIPSAPSISVTNNCGSSTLSTTAPGSLLWSTHQTASSITVSKAGNYTVTQTVNGCASNPGSGTAAPNAIPSTPVVSVSNNCGSSTLSTNATGSLLWSTNETSSSINVSNAGTYTVTQTVNGCTSAAGSADAAPKTAPSKPVITAGGSTNFCQGGSVVLSAPSGFASYKWSNNATTHTITVNQSGAYSVVVSNGNCSSPASDAITVTVGNDTQKPVITCPAAVTSCYDATENYTIALLQATDNCGVASISYTISGATTRSGSGADASGKFSSGTSTITWTVKDGSGNTSTCQSSVTVNEKFTVSIPDGWALGSGCTLNTVYIGYTPASYILLFAKPVGGKSPYTYKWSNGSTASFILVNPATATTYTVTVKDAKGCTQTASKQINVVDVRCGNKMDKVTLCHKGNTLCISKEDVASHLLHGDYLGNCKGKTASREGNEIVEKEVKEENDLTVKASPNPSANFFKLNIITSNVKDKVSISVVDEVGRSVETITATAGQTLQVGDHYRAGVYFVQAIQGNKRVTLKLIKQAW